MRWILVYILYKHIIELNILHNAYSCNILYKHIIELNNVNALWTIYWPENSALVSDNYDYFKISQTYNDITKIANRL